MTDHAATTAAAPASRSLIPLPAPIRRLFDAFPLLTYPPAPLPTSAPRISADAATLHIFTTNPDDDAPPSHNPTCLAYQTFLRLRRVRFRCVPATNHAAPDGRLPYLTPARERRAVPAEKIRRWVVGEEGGKGEGEKGVEMEMEEDTEALAFEALVESSIRDAFLYTLYLLPQNFRALCVPLYAQQCTSNGIVQTLLSHTLRSSALQELHKSRAVLVPEDIYADAAAAWEALSAALGDDEWFLGRNEPGWLDAQVFAYTHLVARALRWCEGENQLARSLQRYGNLLAHEERVRGRCGW